MLFKLGGCDGKVGDGIASSDEQATIRLFSSPITFRLDGRKGRGMRSPRFVLLRTKNFAATHPTDRAVRNVSAISLVVANPDFKIEGLDRRGRTARESFSEVRL
ncbi:MAG: hypothetical protein VX764_06245 [Planctomycetota bacterium]|nr:hypothetical protein [Planctomycetota bacterium]